eukprot:TRINITY_DN87470_c0_g1_i1.p1 TRINITY_DN87470_c0_g1~~TRINITY_DN87470_c0_g1_i1.p1  ORF type:complete len:205 (-),score=38.64 TRINITY_DN87470_c0_g1_i1:45-659(-)
MAMTISAVPPLPLGKSNESCLSEAESPRFEWPSTPSPRSREIDEPVTFTFFRKTTGQRTKLSGKAKAFVPNFFQTVLVASYAWPVACVELPTENTALKGNQSDISQTSASAPASPEPLHVADVKREKAAAERPHTGSELHGTGRCKPCAWFWKPVGCRADLDCEYCHLCDAEELKRRRALKAAEIRSGTWKRADARARPALTLQ